MQWVDSQCHVSPLWYEPVEVLLQQMERNGIGQAVLLQMLGQTDNDYQQACLKRYPGQFASVVMVDVGSAEAIPRLRELAAQGATGVRLRPTARSPEGDPLALWRCAAELDLAVSCVGTADAFASPQFAELIESLPGLTLVLEHLGGTSQPDLEDAARASRLRVFDLARFPNIYLKVPGLGELQPRQPLPSTDGRPFAAQRPDVLELAVTAFGPQRLMWGSDFPPVSAREGYANALWLCREALLYLREEDLDQIFGAVARRVFKLGPPQDART